MQLFYAPDITTPRYTLCPEESKHVVRVLRMGVGARIWITNGLGDMYVAELVDADPKRCVVEVKEHMREYEKRPYGVTMAVAPTKNLDRYEWFLEKATEVWCDAFVPILTEHSERRVLKTERLERVITGAVKQSLKAYHPRLEPLTEVAQIITRPFDGVKLIAHCRDGAERKLMSEVVGAGDNVLVLIGPEGDFSKEEIELAVKHGFVEVSLGESRLRTETAALTAVINIAFINDNAPTARTIRGEKP